MFTIRTIFIVKQLRIQAAVLGLFEALVYVFGFSVGILVGTKIEHKLSIGYSSIFVNLPTKNQILIDKLR
ncbi:DUF5698 domain-containing protein [Sporosarcina sp. P13]|uniref:DUF5698 domain-containing protein n=1 Tax=Sporosarcina sp. P13 TaxID=2048263 RepID=UPI001E353CB5|nr:DUF5698 domain-containing protein [Sporosarcina sp. P13]